MELHFRHLVALAALVTLLGAGCRASQPEAAHVLTRPPAGAYHDPDPTYGMPLPLKVVLASDYSSSGSANDDPAQKTPQWLKRQVTVGSFAPDDGQGGSLYALSNFYDNWPAGFAAFPWQDSNGNDLVQMVNGTAQNTLSAPVADSRVFLLVAGPYLPSGQSWFPVELWRDGSTITLVVEEWFDGLQRFGNIPHRGVELLGLGKLPAGEYTLRVERRVLELDEEGDEFCYRWASTDERSMPFRVSPAPRSAPTTSPTTEPAEAQGSSPPAPAAVLDLGGARAGGRTAPWSVASARREWPVMRPFRLEIDPEAKGISRWLRMGTFDPKRWEVKPEQPAPSEQRPRLSPPDASDPLHASVICPAPLREGEWVALRKVIRSGRDVTLHLDLVGKATVESEPKYYAGVVVPLGFLGNQRYESQPLHYTPGTYRVRVVWRVIQDGGTSAPTGLDPKTADLLDRAVGPVEVTVP